MPAKTGKRRHLLQSKEQAKRRLGPARSSYTVMEGRLKGRDPVVLKRSKSATGFGYWGRRAIKGQVEGYKWVQSSANVPTPKHVFSFIDLKGRAVHVQEKVLPLVSAQSGKGRAVNRAALVRLAPKIVRALHESYPPRGGEEKLHLRGNVSGWGFRAPEELVLLDTGSGSRGFVGEVRVFLKSVRKAAPKSFPAVKKAALVELYRILGEEEARKAVKGV